MPTIVHFEIPADDVERSKKFYSDLFGWKIEKFPGQTGGGEDTEYSVITTTDDKGNKALGGGIMKRQGPQQPIINHIDVKSETSILLKFSSCEVKSTFRKRQFQEWVTSQFVLILRIMLLEYGRLMKMQSELSAVSQNRMTSYS
jgi:hypothetical protein